MKLVEILARELKEWPEGAETLFQVAGGFVYQAGVGVDLLHAELSVDWVTAEVTRAQWEAERARIEKDESDFVAHTGKIQDDAFASAVDELKVSLLDARYEQELWDKVAIEQMKFYHQVARCDFDDALEFGCDEADEFMKERAKRMNG